MKRAIAKARLTWIVLLVAKRNHVKAEQT